MGTTKEVMDWWKTLDMNDEYLINLWSSLFGTVEIRINYLYSIRNNQNFKIDARNKKS